MSHMTEVIQQMNEEIIQFKDIVLIIIDYLIRKPKADLTGIESHIT